ncbi:BRO family protein [Xenorhabdus sp. TS4]|uniref:BRO-N domain-containing protein n=1 Tax=Xenorhabdus sp. TS4 TaxID=1873483 RepID=UPI001656CA0C|nr:BRO family protein [Xenorhabdus sp. TS4]MBC8948947.1 antirepressor protein [Xenorhabdus sp. TS4]
MTSKNAALIGQGLAHSESSPEPILNIDSADISFIKFEGVQVRIFKNNNEPWFIAADVCKALEISNVTNSMKALDDDENTLCSIKGITDAGNPIFNAISESGFYKLITRSRKATKQGTFAHRFANWVFREVIPSIRKTGSYGVPFAALNDFTRRQNEYKAIASQRGRDLQSCKGELASLNKEGRELWRTYQPDLLEEAE